MSYTGPLGEVTGAGCRLFLLTAPHRRLLGKMHKLVREESFATAAGVGLGRYPAPSFALPVGVARQSGDPALIYRSIRPLSPSRGFVKEHQAACNTGLVLPSGKRPRECGHEPAMILRWSGRLWPLLFPLMDNC